MNHEIGSREWWSAIKSAEVEALQERSLAQADAVSYLRDLKDGRAVAPAFRAAMRRWEAANGDLRQRDQAARQDILARAAEWWDAHREDYRDGPPWREIEADAAAE